MGFSPVLDWEFTEKSTAVISEHLKVCPFNRDEDKIIHTEPFQALFEFNTNTEGDILMANKTIKNVRESRKKKTSYY